MQQPGFFLLTTGTGTRSKKHPQLFKDCPCPFPPLWVVMPAPCSDFPRFPASVGTLRVTKPPPLQKPLHAPLKLPFAPQQGLLNQILLCSGSPPSCCQFIWIYTLIHTFSSTTGALAKEQLCCPVFARHTRQGSGAAAAQINKVLLKSDSSDRAEAGRNQWKMLNPSL